MSGPDRINLAGVFCSVAGHAAVFGGLLLSNTHFQSPAMADSQISAPVPVTLVSLNPFDLANVERPTAAQPSTGAGTRTPRPAPPMEGQASSATSPGSAAAQADGAEASEGEPPLRTGGIVDPGLLSDYQRRLNQLIASHCRYPDEAKRLNLAGVTFLAFRVDRSGRVLESWVQDSSGSELLDDAALEALDRAQPLPSIPAGLPDRLDFVVQVDSSLVRRLAVRTGS